MRQFSDRLDYAPLVAREDAMSRWTCWLSRGGPADTWCGVEHRSQLAAQECQQNRKPGDIWEVREIIHGFYSRRWERWRKLDWSPVN